MRWREGVSLVRQIIVIAWVSEESVPVRLGARHKMKPCYVAKAAVWLLDGRLIDVDKARVYCDALSGEKRHVFTYPMAHPDPLGAARRDILALAPLTEVL